MEFFCMNKVRVSMVIMCKRNCFVVFWRILFGIFMRFFDVLYIWLIGFEFFCMLVVMMYIIIGSVDMKR